MKKSLYVINYRGGRKPFSIVKVYRGARKAGASRELAQEISQIIQREAYPGIKTLEIFNRIKELLNRESLKLGIKFSLKEGMKKLGPSGFPFEKFIGEIFSRQGYEIKLNQYLQGYCLKYEIDFLAKKGNMVYVGECKFRALLEEGRVHSETALAYRAKTLDLRKGNIFKKKEEFNGFNVRPILVTNAKFTKAAAKYSRCAGIELLGWKSPKSGGLESIIDRNGFYPITILPSLKKDLVDVFIKRKMILAKDVLKINPQKFSKQTGISEKNLNSLIKEAKILFEA